MGQSRKREPIIGALLPLLSHERDLMLHAHRRAALVVADWAWRQGQTKDALLDVLEILGIENQSFAAAT